MPKLCDKCHKNPAVVHIRAIHLDGTKQTVSYCLSCAQEIISEKDSPAGLKEMLNELMKDIHKDGQLELNLGDSPLELPKSKGKKSPAAPAESSHPISCPRCRNTVGFSKNDDKPLKCGHCLISLRESLQEQLLEISQASRGDTASDLAGGFPPMRTKETTGDCDRLVKLLQCYQKALVEKRKDAAELLKEEICGLRMHLTEHVRTLAHPSPQTLAIIQSFEARDCRSLITTRNDFWRKGWLPPTAVNRPQIRLSSAILAQRTMVDVPMPEDAKAEDYHRKLAEIIWHDPIFDAGMWNGRDYSLFTLNNRLMVDCGASPICDRRAFHFEVLCYGSPQENQWNLRQVQNLLARLEERCNFFMDPDLGYFYPQRQSGGSGIYPMEFLHLPALCSTVGLPRLRKAVQAMAGYSCLPHDNSLTLEAPEGLECDPGDGSEVISGFLVLRDNRTVGVPLTERVDAVHAVARLLEKRELRARTRASSSLLLRERAMDGFKRSRAVLENSRILSQQEAVRAVSQLWLAQELGCYPSLSKEAILMLAQQAVLTNDDLLERPYLADIDFERLPPLAEPGFQYGECEDYDQPLDTLWEDQDRDVKVYPKQSAPALDSLKKFLSDIPNNPQDFLEHIQEFLGGNQDEEQSDESISEEEALMVQKLEMNRARLLRRLLLRNSAPRKS